MAITFFKSFVSTVTPFKPASWIPALKLLVDPTTGAPVGIQSQNAGGPDGIWTPVDITATQVSAPSALMIADLNAVYRLSVAPYTRYQSDGTQLVPLGGGGIDGTSYPGAVVQTVPVGAPGSVIGPNSYAVIYSPWTIQNAAGVTVQGRVDVITRPA